MSSLSHAPNSIPLFVRIIMMLAALVSAAHLYADPLVRPFTYHESQTLHNQEPELAPAVAGPMETLLRAIVTVKTTVPDNARTAKSLGTEREGSGVVIDANGLIATVGYILAEATTASVSFSDGQTEEAEIVAFDEATGLGLLRTQSDVATIPISLGQSADLKSEQTVLIVPAAGESEAKGVKIGKVERFTSGWEFMINDAIHTYPPSTSFSGAALVSEKAELLGIGALVTIDIDIDPKVRVPGNIFVPIDSLKAVLGELLTAGRSSQSRKPWLGLDTKQTKKGVVVSSVIDEGPAQKSGIQSGDIIVAVDQAKIKNMGDLFEKIWSSFEAGDKVHLLIIRGDQYANVPVDTIDYYDWLSPAQDTSTTITELSD